jgi:fluoride ion exporter CrcB/FEX
MVRPGNFGEGNEMTPVVSTLVIALLGAVGALVRAGLLQWFARATWPTTYSTVVANIVGSLGAGLVMGADWGVWSWWLAAGLFGAVTTFSTIAVDVAEKLRGEHKGGWALLLWHVLGGLMGFLMGYQIAAVVF